MTRWRFRTDEQNDVGASQHDPVETWAAPRTLTQAVIDKAKTDLAAYEIFMRPAPLGPIEREGTRGHWLMQLSMLCAGQKGSMQEYMEKTAAYAKGLQYPAFCFTSKTLYSAARKFKFIPTFSELSDYFSPMVRDHQKIVDRIAALANSQPYDGLLEHKAEVIKRWSDMTPDEQRRHDEDIKAMKSRLAAAGIGDSAIAKLARRLLDETNDRSRALLEPILAAKRAALLGDDQP